MLNVFYKCSQGFQNGKNKPRCVQSLFDTQIYVKLYQSNICRKNTNTIYYKVTNNNIHTKGKET